MGKQQDRKLPDLTGSSTLIVDEDQGACESICLMLQENGIHANRV